MKKNILNIIQSVYVFFLLVINETHSNFAIMDSFVTPSTTNFYDLNEDCLRIIFDYLDRYDLLNLVDFCSRFYDLGREMYEKKFTTENIINVRFNDKSMQLLCRFGDCIPDLKVAVYYRKSLNGLFKILENRCNHNLTELFIEDSVINEQCECNFPNLKILEFHRVRFENCKPIERSFPSLSKVKIRHSLLAIETVINFLECNPQIENVLLYDTTSISANSVSTFMKNVCNLKELHLKFGWNLTLTPFINSKFNFAKLQKLTIWCDTLGDSGHDLVAFTSNAPNIKEIELISSHVYISNNTITEMFRLSRFLTNFSACGLISMPHREFNLIFHNKLRETTSNRDDFWIKLFVNGRTLRASGITDRGYNVMINKTSFSIEPTSHNDLQYCRNRRDGYNL